MEIPMSTVVASYREKLSDIIHQLTLKELHIKELERVLAEKRKEIDKLQMDLDIYRLAEEYLSDEPDDWGPDAHGNSDEH